MERSKSNHRLFWSIIVTVGVLDALTKRWAVAGLRDRPFPVPVVGEGIRLTLVYNPGAAFGLHLGPYSRWIFMALTVGALVILWRLYRATKPGDVVRTLALGLVCGGALGNLVDRLRSDMGVVDFIDVGLNTLRWPTFNVADMAVSCGAFLLAFVLWGEDREEMRAAAAAAAAAASASASSTVASDPG